MSTSSSNSEEEEVELFSNMATVATVVALLDDDEEEYDEIDHRIFARNKRTVYDHARAYQCIMDDYLSPLPRFNGREFETIFRISTQRFERLRQDFANSGHSFYSGSTDALNRNVASLETRLLLPLKCLAYGVPAQAFRDYFQVSKTHARIIRRNFDIVLRELYQEEYLRMPTAEDLKSLSDLHQQVHGVPGMLGSLDCMHNAWKNCPIAWQGAYQGAKKIPTLVLEGLGDHNLFLWWGAFGYAGTLNDITIFDMSPIQENILNGTMSALERESGAVPFEIAGKKFDAFFILVDGIYPQYSRFVKTLAEPILEWEKLYSAWQEAVRKDIERLYGVLQIKFQYMARPFMELDLNIIGDRVNSCLLLHNMCVSDRVMGDVHARYKPSAFVSGGQFPVDKPEDLDTVQGYPETVPELGWTEQPPGVEQAMKRRLQWNSLMDIHEHERLHKALIKSITKNKEF